MFGWPFRSTRERIEELQRARQTASTAHDILVEIPPVAGAFHVSAEFSEHRVRIDVDRLGFFTMSANTAFNFARQIEGAAEALGPEPANVDESVDVPIEEGDGDE